MDEYQTNPMEDDDLVSAPETPEDVAVLYTWANVHGGKYRDFSASRREYRAQQRHRMVEAQRHAELEAAREREEQAALEVAEARKREAESEAHSVARTEAEENRRRAEEHAAQERLAAQKHVETAEELKLALVQAQREMEDARRRAEEQAARYAEADARWRAQQRGMAEVVPGEMNDPYYYAGPLEPGAFAPGKGVRSSVPQRVSSERRIVESYYKTKGESSPEVEARRDEARRDNAEPYGLFSSGQRNRNSSGARSIYREVAPASAPQEVRVRPETPEDTRERNRGDERQRVTGAQGGQFDDNADDYYYDRSPRESAPQPPAPRSPADRNSAPSDLHIPPRMQQAYSPQDSGERKIMRSEDPEPGNTHNFEQSRARRHESTEDVSARTARRPRSSDAYQEPEKFETAARRDADSRDVPSIRPQAPRALYEQDERQRYAAPREDRPARPERSNRPLREEPNAGEDRPEWLVRDGRASEREVAEERARDAEGRKQERDAFEAFLTRTDVTPRTTDDRPARSAYMERENVREEERPAPPREVAPAEPSFEERAAARREARRNRPSAGLTREVTPGVPLTDSQTVRAADGGFNLRPMLDRPPIKSLPPMQDRTQDREESEERPAAPARAVTPPPVRDLPPLREAPPVRAAAPPAREAEPVREAPSVREVPFAREAPRMREVPPASIADAAQEIRTDWPRVERRRYERASGSRGVEAQLDSSREFRAAARAAEQEQQRDRPRPQSGRREAGLREDLGQDARSREPQTPSAPHAETVRSSASPATDTLQQSRERVAARWFALKGLMGAPGDSSQEIAAQPARSREFAAVPMLSIVSLSGGVGKTSLVATLGRSLSSAGEKVLLADTTAHGLLPYYFGARELRPDVVRTFSPPPGSTDAPVYMVNYLTDRLNGDEAGQAALVEEIARHAKGTQRVLLDLNGSSAWLARRLGQLNSSVLVPIAPDMNSVLSIQGVERFFAGAQDSDGRRISPYYVLNQFDASLPLHLDVREVLRQQLGDRLLPVMIRRSQSVSEALAEGMTVIDYAPESPVTEDYTHLAEWVRNLAAPAANAGLRSIRWSER